MANIAPDTSADLGNSTVSGYSVAYTCSGTDRILIVTVMGDTGASSNVTGITYNGVALTKAVSVTRARTTDIWILVNPASGSHNIVFTFTAAKIWALASSYSGAKQSGQPDGSNTNSVVSATSIADTITTTADNCWMIGIAEGATSGPLTAGSNTTARQIGNGQFGLYDTNAAQTPAGSHSLNWTMTAQNAVAAAISIAPSTTSTITVTDTQTSTDILSKTLSRSVTDTTVNTEFLNRSLTRSIVDTSIGTDVLTTSRLITKTIIDAATSIDIISTSFLWTRRTKPSSIWTDRTPPTTPWI